METIEKINKFQNKIEALKRNGLKMKNIAEILEIQPSVLSGLYRTVFPYILNNKNNECKENLIINAFSYVNNISKEKTLYNLHHYLKCLEQQIEPETEFSDTYNDFLNSLKNHIKDSTDINLQGFYYCYSHSSNFNEIKKEPFLITKCKNSYLVKKGNSKSNISFEGILFVINKQNIYINLIDNETKIEENQTMIFNRPFIKKPDIIRGIYLGLNFLKQPVARRVVLKKVTDSISLSDYEKHNTSYLSKTESSNFCENNIVKYLSDRNDIIECLSVPYPSLNTKELLIEKEMLKQYKKIESEVKSV